MSQAINLIPPAISNSVATASMGFASPGPVPFANIPALILSPGTSIYQSGQFFEIAVASDTNVIATYKCTLDSMSGAGQGWNLFNDNIGSQSVIDFEEAANIQHFYVVDDGLGMLNPIEQFQAGPNQSTGFVSWFAFAGNSASIDVNAIYNGLINLQDHTTSPAPAEGQIAWNFGNHCPCVYTGSAWHDLVLGIPS